jgi:hypothetical protein
MILHNVYMLKFQGTGGSDSSAVTAGAVHPGFALYTIDTVSGSISVAALLEN